MYYFNALRELFSAVYDTNFLRILKPSARKEKWVGFDQAWVKTTVSTSELFEQLKVDIAQGQQNNPYIYFGFFLQFKPVERMFRRSVNTPVNFPSNYFRCKLDLRRNDTTDLSQHETLKRLSNLRRTDVSYACPMIFEPQCLWNPPNMEDIKFVPVTISTPTWVTGSHYINFATENDDNPVWKSEEEQGKAISVKDWSKEIVKMNGEKIIELIETSVKEIIKFESNKKKEISGKHKDKIAALMPESFTLIEMKPKDEAE